MSKRVTSPESQVDLAASAERRRSDDEATLPPAKDALQDSDSPGMQLDGAERSLSEKSRRARQSPLASTVRWIVLAVALIAGTALIAVVANLPQRAGPAGDSPDASRTNNRARGNASPRHAPPANARSESFDKIIAKVEDSIVKIESGGPAGVENLGSGFIIDQRGLIATSYHVIADSTDGRVRFRGGAVYNIEGYAAVDIHSDLAILKLRDAPAIFQPLPIRSESDPAEMSAVIAIGHPHGIDFSPFDGKVSRVLNTSQLPKHSQRFLAEHTQSRLNHRWIQHTAGLSEGNSGGPLLNERGEVIGVNTWIDALTGFNYALHAAHLAPLRENMLEQIAPLEQYATKEARVNAAMQRLSVSRVERLYTEAEQMNWAPQTGLDYETLQQLAWSLTVARFPSSFGGGSTLDESLLEDLIKVADQVESRLKQNRSALFRHITLINEFAAGQVSRPGAGVFFFGTVERVVTGKDNSRAMLMQLSGFDQMLLLPLDGIFFDPSPGSHYLVLGVNQDGREVHYGDNPLQLITAPVIISRTILPLEE